MSKQLHFLPSPISSGEKKGDPVATIPTTEVGNQAKAELEHHLRIEGALVECSRMLFSNETVDFQKLLGFVGEAIAADCVYFVTTPPDDLLLSQSGAQGLSEHRLHGPGNQDVRSYIQSDDKNVIIWQKGESYRGLSWLQQVEFETLLDSQVPVQNLIKTGDTGESVPYVIAVPILSSKDQFFGYLGFEYEQEPKDWRDANGRVLSVLGDLLSSYFERKLAASSQRDSEDRWRMLVEKNPEPILIVADEEILYINQRGAALLGGESSDQIIGSKTRYYMTAEAAESLTQLEPNIDEQAIGPIEQTIIRLDGEERFVEWFSVPVYYKGYRAAQIVIRDITERKIAERALQESESRFRLLADSAPVLIWMTGPKGKGSYFNQTWLSFTGRELTDELGDSWLQNVHTEDVSSLQGIFLSSLKRRKPFSMEFRLRRHDGQYRWMLDSGIPRFTNDGKFVGYVGSCVDITDRKEAMEAIRASEERYRTFIETISEAIWRVEMESPMPLHLPAAEQVDYIVQRGYVAECNDALARLVGAESQERIVGLRLREVFPQFERNVLQDFVACGYQLRNGEYTMDHPGVDRKHLVINVVGMIDNELLVRIWGSCVDVTERIELEQQMVAALEHQQQRFGRDLHDGVGQLLTAVRMLSSNLADRFFTESEDGYQLARKVVKFSEEASQRVREIHNGLAPFQLFQDGLVVVLQDLASDLNALPGVSCTFISDGKTDVQENDTMLHLFRIAQEATNNALKYAHAKNIVVSLITEGEDKVLQIEDNGVGFDVNNRRNGKSLGLRSMYYRSRSIGGTLSIKSQPNVGTTIRCVIPARHRLYPSAVPLEGNFDLLFPKD